MPVRKHNEAPSAEQKELARVAAISALDELELFAADVNTQQKLSRRPNGVLGYDASSSELFHITPAAVGHRAVETSVKSMLEYVENFADSGRELGDSLTAFLAGIMGTTDPGASKREKCFVQIINTLRDVEIQLKRDGITDLGDALGAVTVASGLAPILIAQPAPAASAAQASTTAQESPNAFDKNLDKNDRKKVIVATIAAMERAFPLQNATITDWQGSVKFAVNQRNVQVQPDEPAAAGPARREPDITASSNGKVFTANITVTITPPTPQSSASTGTQPSAPAAQTMHITIKRTYDDANKTVVRDCQLTNTNAEPLTWAQKCAILATVSMEERKAVCRQEGFRPDTRIALEAPVGTSDANKQILVDAYLAAGYTEVHCKIGAKEVHRSEPIAREAVGEPQVGSNPPNDEDDEEMSELDRGEGPDRSLGR